MRIYIAGKITGNPEAKRRFEATEKMLQEAGDETINPHTIGEHLPEMDHLEILHVCFALIDTCDGVYFMDNWKSSPGACMEYGYAIARGKALYFQEEP